MSGADFTAWCVGVLLGLGALFVAVKNIRNGMLWLWRTFGWHGSFWAFIQRAVDAVQVILDQPGQNSLILGEVAAVKKDLGEHITYSEGRNALLDDLASQVKEIGPKVDAIHYQMHPNGGGSAVDKLTRIEHKVTSLEPARVHTGPVTVIIPTTPNGQEAKP